MKEAIETGIDLGCQLGADRGLRSDAPDIAQQILHWTNNRGAAVGVQTDGGAMFVAEMSSVIEPPINDVWTVPGEEALLSPWQVEDRALFEKPDPATYYHRLQDQEFLKAILGNRDPAVTEIEGRKTVELFSAR